MFKIGFNHILHTFFIFLILAGVLWLNFYLFKKDLSKKRLTFFVINTVASLLIITMIFKPEVSLKVPFGVKEKICVIFDTSLSMGVSDQKGITRLDKVKEFVNTEPLLKKFDISFYTVGESLKKIETEKLDNMSPNQNVSFILSGLEQLNKKTGNTYKSILLFSDGQESRVEDMQVLHDIFNTPIISIGMGGEDILDISVADVTTNSPIYTGESLRAEININQKGYDNTTKKVLLKENNRVVQEKEVFLSEASSMVVFEVVVSSAGEKIYEVEILPEKSELVKDNNRMFFMVRAISPKINLLYVENGLRWEYKYLKRYIESASGLVPVFLVKVGDNVFQYAQVEGKGVPADIFSDNLFLEKFSIIIFGDINFSSFTLQQRKNIKDFYIKKGRSLMFLGGDNFLQGIVGTELNIITSPITTSKKVDILEGRFLPEITDEGSTLPIFSGRETGFPSITRVNSVYSLQKGAVPLLKIEKSGMPIILSATNISVEGGKSVFVGTDDIWKWAFGSEQEQSDYRFFWGRLIRYLWAPKDYIGEGKIVPYININKKTCSIGEKLEATFQFTDEKNNRSFETLLQHPDGTTEPLLLNEMRTSFIPQTEGMYTLKTISEGKINMVPVLARKEGDEFLNIGRNEYMLKQLAELSKGAYIPFEEKDRLKEIMKKEKNYITKNLAFSKTSMKYVILFLFIILNLGWHLRRQNS